MTSGLPRGWRLVGLGLLLFGVSVLYVVLDSDPLLTISAELLLPTLIGLLLLVEGYWLPRRNPWLDRAALQSVAASVMLGGVVFAAFIGWLLFVMDITGAVPMETGYLVLNGVAAGMASFGLLGVLYVRIQYEKALIARSEHEYLTLFTSIRDAILVADTDRRIVNCNPAFTDLFGYDLADIRGEPTSTIYESQAEYEALGEAIEAHRDDPNFVHTVNYLTASGEVFPGETNVFHHTDETGEIRGYIGLIRDVSDRKERIRQLHVMDRLLRHNIRNALNIIMGHADLLMANGNATRNAHGRYIIETGEQLLQTTEKQRDIIELLSDPPARRVASLTTMCEHVVRDLHQAYPDAEITLSVPEDLDVECVSEFEYGLRELGENALRHNPSLEPWLQVGVTAENGSARIVFEDDGPGIPEEEFTVVLGQEYPKQLYHGSGLGLWLSKHVVSRSGGTLRFQDRDPTGTAVSVTIPLAS